MSEDTFTNQVLRLEVNEHHTLYVQDWGNPDATVPIIALHGGPGGKSKDSHKNLYDPTKQRVIFFDQRGCGQSLPYGSRKDNTTADLIADINKIADELQIKRFVIAGRSWGSCLALAYALEYPKRVAGMVLGGIFTGSKEEIDWVDKGLFEQFFPDAWQKYQASVPSSHQKNPSTYHFERVMEGPINEAKRSAFAYETLVGAIAGLDDRPRQSDFATYDPASISLEIYYMENGCFLPDRHILKNAHTLQMPITLIQGRYDMICPPNTAFALHDALPNSHLYTTLSGHISQHEDTQLIRQALAHVTS